MQWNNLRGHLRNMYKIIKLYRHGETVWNKEGRLQGWLDSPLTEYGKAQAKKQVEQVRLVFSSDLGRAMETANLMFPQAKLLTDKRLREIYLGDWQGKYISVLTEQSHYNCYIERPSEFVAHTQESFQAVTQRMQEFFDYLLTRAETNIAVVSHGVAIACLIAAIEERPLDLLWQDGLLQGGSCVTLVYQQNKWQIVREERPIRM